MSTKITYNNKEVKLKNGDSAVVESRDKKLLHDIEIKDTTITEPITITENGFYPVPEPVLKWNTDWKFKEEISAQSFEEIFATYPEDIYYGISIGSTEKWTVSITRATNENGFFGDLITLPSNKAVYFILCQDSEGVDDREYACFDGWTEEEFAALNEAFIAMDLGPAMIKGWCTRGRNEYYASSAPIISAVPESFTGIDLELLSAFFELEKIDGWGDITVNVAGGGSGTSAPLVLTHATKATFNPNVIPTDTRVRFKSVITEEDMAKYRLKARIDEYGGYSIDGYRYFIFIEPTDVGEICMIGTDQMEFNYFPVPTPNYGVEQAGWYAMDFETGAMIPCDPPETVLLSGLWRSADLETTSIFFDYTPADSYSSVSISSSYALKVFLEGGNAPSTPETRDNLEEFTIVDDLIEFIPDNCFGGKSLFVGGIFVNVKTIGARGFQGSCARRLDFHSLTEIGASGLSVGELATLIIRTNSVCALGANNNLNSTKIYVPQVLVDAYKTAPNWSAFADNIRAIEDYPEICDV